MTPTRPAGTVVQIPRFVFGAGSLGRLGAELTRTGVTRPLIVTDRNLDALGFTGRAADALSAAQRSTVYTGVSENPVFADADLGAERYAAAGCDGVVAIGGGSVIDAAKYIALIATNGGAVADFVRGPRDDLKRCAPLIAIPTTAGTGSEASPDAGIHPASHLPSVGMSAAEIIPSLALLDPELTVGLPPRLTAATGIDALSHCIEGYLSRERSPIVDALALDGVKRVRGYLQRAVDDGGDLDARGQMMAAAFAGGVAIGMGLGPAHAIAITCGDQGGQHGVLSGIGLVCALDQVEPHAPERLQRVAEALELSSAHEVPGFLASWMRHLGLPATLAELGYRMVDLEAAAAAAHSSPFNFRASHHPTREAYASMLGTSLGLG